MIRKVFALLCPLGLLASLVAATPAAAMPAAHPQTVFFDAIFTHAQTAGPGPAHVGHRQIVSGILRDAGGRRIGSFSFTCAWTRVEPSGAHERCTASAVTSDGQLDAAGPSQSASSTHAWRLTAGTGLYRAASGTVSIRDLGEREALLSASITTIDHARLHAGKVNRPAANQGFIARANALCARASDGLASLPSFPFPTFDPLHPAPSLLPAVGAFFTGAGDPRPIFRRLDTALRGLGEPVRERALWRAAMTARDRELAVIGEQDEAALAADVRSFVASVRDDAAAFRRVALTATIFGIGRCVI